MRKTALATIAALAATGLVAGNAQAAIEVTAGYLDSFIPNTPGPAIDIGNLGGGIDGDPSTKHIFVDPSRADNGRVGGIAVGKFFVTGVPQAGGVAPNLDAIFDASSQLIRVTNLPAFAGTFEQSIPLGGVGYDGQVNNAYGVSDNFPPTAGGSAAVWVPGIDQNADPNIFDGEVTYLFSVSIAITNDNEPGLEPGNTYVVTALVGNASGGAVTYGSAANFPSLAGVLESQLDLFDGSLSITGATIGPPAPPGTSLTTATLLTSVAITVIPEPAALSLLLAGSLALLRRRR
jgi:hypothetical protein